MGTEPGANAPNQTVVDTYDRLATPYDWLVGPLEAGSRDRALSLLSLGGSDRVLEVGCGPGHALVELARRLDTTGQVVGLDAAPRMLVRARERIGRAASPRQVCLLQGDARSLPLASETVDAVFIEDTLELFSADGRAAVLAEIRRVLAPDGRLVVVTMERENAESHPFVRAYDWVFEHVPGYDRVGCRPIYARHVLETSGFAIDRQERHRRAYVWPVEILRARPAD